MLWKPRLASLLQENISERHDTAAGEEQEFRTSAQEARQPKRTSCHANQSSRPGAASSQTVGDRGGGAVDGGQASEQEAAALIQLIWTPRGVDGI
jgi:hypothetical protein